DHRNRVRCRSTSCGLGTPGRAAAASESALVRDAHKLQACDDAPAYMAAARCTRPTAADSAATREQAWRAPRSATVQYCSHSPKIARRRMDSGLSNIAQ